MSICGKTSVNDWRAATREINILRKYICYLPTGGGGSLPDQSGHAGEFLTTDGTDASWAASSGGGWAVTGTTTLTGDATIDADGHSLLIQNGAAGIGLDPDNIAVGGDGGSIQISPTDIRISLGIGATFVYAADYSANYTSRSLVDKAWVLANAGTPAGSNTQLQFNNSGAFGASASLTWDATNGELDITSITAARGLKVAGPNAAIVVKDTASGSPRINLENAAGNQVQTFMDGSLNYCVQLAGQSVGLRFNQSSNGLQIAADVTLVVAKPTFLQIGASSTARSQIFLAVGAAPTSPNDGDMWLESNTNTGLKIRINGVTKSFTLI